MKYLRNVYVFFSMELSLKMFNSYNGNSFLKLFFMITNLIFLFLNIHICLIIIIASITYLRKFSVLIY